MATRKRLFVLLLVSVSCLLAAQETGSGSFVIKSGEDFQIRQIISFPADLDALRYEVELERIEDGQTVPLDKIVTETNRIEIALKAGSYRYRITSYNGWDLVNGISDWQIFTVFLAMPPVAGTYQPFYGLYYELADPTGTLAVMGQDLYNDSEFALVIPDTDFDWSNTSLENNKRVVYPSKVTVSDDHTRAVLEFSRKNLKQGEYTIFIRNPGGLWSVFGQVRVGYRKNADWTLSFGWMPMIAAFDYENAYDEHWEWDHSTFTTNQIKEQRLDAFNPRAWYFRVGWFPAKTRLGNFGLEVTLMSLQDKASAKENTDFGDQVFAISGGHVDLVYQKEFTEHWQGNIRFGMGGGEKYHNNNESYDEDEIPMLFNFGISAQYFIWKNLYAEGGIDLQYMMQVDHTMIRPFLGLGWHFGRWAEYMEVTKLAGRGEDPSAPVTEIPKSEFTFSLGWSPMIPMFGISLKESHHYWNGSTPVTDETTMLRPFNPLGAYFRVAYIPYRWGKNKLGAEFELYILEHPNRQTLSEEYRNVDILSHAQFEVLYQRVLTKPWQLNARAGMGISNPYAFDDTFNDDTVVAYSINAGASVQYFFWKNAYVEGGLDFMFTFGEVKHGIFRPGIGIGWQFNRDAPTGFTEDGLKFRFFNKEPKAVPAEE
jgi:hypothetical protein